MLVVWEPILETDRSSPSPSTLGLISDRRATQFWDPQHLVAQELGRMARQKPGQPEPTCCVKNGYLWDDALLYAPHAKWGDNPAPAFSNGPVVRVVSGLEKALRKLPR